MTTGDQQRSTFRRRGLSIAALALLAGAGAASAGGAGPLKITALHGLVEIKSLEKPDARWERARPGPLGGRLLLRTGSRSWAHLDGKRWCLDPDSLLLIDSAADYWIEVLRGRVSAADGRRGKRIFRVYDTATRAGVVVP